MGMHFGFLAAASPWSSLRPALEAECGPFDDLGDVPESEWFDPLPGEDVLKVAEAGGGSYVLDRELVLSTDPDLIVRLSQALGCRVVGAGAESTSMTIWFIAAENGVPRRVHFDAAGSSPEPFELGEQLPGESADDWPDTDGAGVFAAVAAYGFDHSVLVEGPAGGGHAFAWTSANVPEAGELGRRLGAHLGYPSASEPVKPPGRLRRMLRRR